MNELDHQRLLEARANILWFQNVDLGTFDSGHNFLQNRGGELVVERLQSFQRTYRVVRCESLDDLPTTRVKELWRLSHDLRARIGFLFGDRGVDSHFAEHPAEYLSSVQNETREAFQSAAALLASYDLNAMNDLTNATAAIAKARTLSDENSAALAQSRADGQVIVEQLRSQLADVALRKQANHFAKQAGRHMWASVFWFAATVLSTSLLLCFAYNSLGAMPRLDSEFKSIVQESMPNFPMATFVLVQFGVARALLFAALASLTLFTAKMFRAERHNAIVSQHRENVLLTYPSLVESAADQSIRDGILNRAVHEIFSAQSTNFVTHDTDEGKALSILQVGTDVFKKN